MPLEEYFNFLAPNDIRVKGTRVGIETILYDFIYRMSEIHYLIDENVDDSLRKGLHLHHPDIVAWRIGDRRIASKLQY